MKKIYIVMAVIATAALVSCEREKSFDDGNLGENSVVFAIKSGSTRSAQVVSEARQGIVIPLETENGSRFVLEETVTSLDQFTPATKGAPAYTENLGKLYANDLNVWGDAGGFGTDATFSNMENSLYPRKDADLGSGWRYQHDYTGDPWPSEDGDVGFYLNMPAEPTNVTMGTRSGGKFTFTYTSPATAAEQQDILFAYRQTDKAEYLADFHPNGIPVLFNHALTAVKFAIGNTDSDITTNKIKITKITFKDLVDDGTCTITPASEDNYKDNESTYSSAGATSWSSLKSTGTEITSDTYGNTVDYDSGEFGASWYTAGNKKNLNKADGSQTFWLIPQTFSASSTVKLTIEYTFDGNTDSWEIDFGKFLAGVTWQAGELRTYTIKIDDVNVQIEDTVEMAEKSEQTIVTPWGEREADSYEGSTKTDVVITNTGNTDAYIRVALIGQWRNSDGNPVFGFTDYTEGVQLVDSWYEDLFVKKTNIQGKFEGLPGANWTEGSDGYYYYTVAVPAGEEVPDELFTSYTVGKCPAAAIAGEVQNIYFTLEIAVQAVSAKKLNGSNYTYSEAWERALATE